MSKKPLISPAQWCQWNRRYHVLSDVNGTSDITCSVMSMELPISRVEWCQPLISPARWCQWNDLYHLLHDVNGTTDITCVVMSMEPLISPAQWCQWNDLYHLLYDVSGTTDTTCSVMLIKVISVFLFLSGKKGGALASSIFSYMQHGDPYIKALIKHTLTLVGIQGNVSATWQPYIADLSV